MSVAPTSMPFAQSSSMSLHTSVTPGWTVPLLSLQSPLADIPPGLADLPLTLSEDGHSLVYTFDTQSEDTGIAPLLRRLNEQGIDFKDLHSSESSLEDIFVSLVRAPA